MNRLITFTALCLTLITPHIQADPIKLAASHWAPYIDQQRPDGGVATALVRNIFKRAGYEVELYYLRWPDVLEGVANGTLDGIVAAWKSPGREKHLHFSNPYIINSLVFIKKRGASYDYNGDIASLDGSRIATVEGYSYSPLFNRSGGFTRVISNDVTQSLLHVAQGDADMAIDDQWAIRYAFAAMAPNAVKNFEFLSTPLAERGLHMAIRNDHPQREKIIADFNTALKRMQDDGTIDDMMEQFRERLAGELAR